MDRISNLFDRGLTFRQKISNRRIRQSDGEDRSFTCSTNKGRGGTRPEVLVEPCSSLETFLAGRASGRLDLDLQFPRFLADSRRGGGGKGITPLRQITSILRSPPLRPTSMCRAVRAQLEESDFSLSLPATLREEGRTRKEREVQQRNKRARRVGGSC